MTSVHALTGASLIGAGESHEGPEFHATDPATGARLEPAYHDAGPADVDHAAALAEQAFERYRQTSPAERAAFLETIAAEIEALGDTLTDRVTAETGIPTARVEGETARTTGQLRLFADVVRDGSWSQARLDTPDPARTPLPKPDLRQRSIPVGPVAVFAASNFPLAFSVAGGDTASALAAGAPVIVKAHPGHPGTSELVGRAVGKAVAVHGFPEGVFSLLISSGIEVGVSLVSDPRIKAVGFTGSRRAGLALTAAAAARPVPIPVYAEMSSINPVFVFPGAMADRAAQLGRDFVASMLTGLGQLCTSPGVVFVADGPDAEVFISAAAAALADAPGGPLLNAGIAAAFTNGARRAAETPGVQQVAAGGSNGGGCAGAAQLLVTTAEDYLRHAALADEVFGPSSVIVRTRPDQLADVVATLDGQLTATVHATTADHPQVAGLLPRLELLAGRLVFNGWPTGVEVGHATVHGGPFPATSAPSTTSVGSRAIERFLRPVAYQNFPEDLVPKEIRRDNPLGIPQRVDGHLA
ncbi:MAG: aldehyde dehydrogenase (NADP(+)) [Mycobacterium sp.]